MQNHQFFPRVFDNKLYYNNIRKPNKKEEALITAEILSSIVEHIETNVSYGNIFPNSIVFCTRTSRSKKPKPIVNNVYICRKLVDTKWGTKVIVIDSNGEETWGDIDNLISLPKHILMKFRDEDIENLKEKLHDTIMNDCTPIICEVIKKNNAGIEVSLTTGQKVFLSKKIIYPEKMYTAARKKEVIEVNIPVWFARANKIIETE